MKLAEALVNRADCQKRIEQLRQRLARSAKVQEGETPPENLKGGIGDNVLREAQCVNNCE